MPFLLLLGLIGACPAGEDGGDECSCDVSGRKLECGDSECMGSLRVSCLTDPSDPTMGLASSRPDSTCDGTTCRPNCFGKECGSDGCGGTCSPGCSAGESCNDTTFKCEASGCTPECGTGDDARECGDDANGCSCGSCTTAGETCNDTNGKCEAPADPCAECTADETCDTAVTPAVCKAKTLSRLKITSEDGTTTHLDVSFEAATGSGYSQTCLEQTNGGDFEEMIMQFRTSTGASPDVNLTSRYASCSGGTCAPFHQLLADPALPRATGTSLATSGLSGVMDGEYRIFGETGTLCTAASTDLKQAGGVANEGVVATMKCTFEHTTASDKLMVEATIQCGDYTHPSVPTTRTCEAVCDQMLACSGTCDFFCPSASEWKRAAAYDCAVGLGPADDCSACADILR